MKKGALATILLFTLAVGAGQAFAGHGTIEETDTAIIVEYYGDPVVPERPDSAAKAAEKARIESAALASGMTVSPVAYNEEQAKAREAYADARRADKEARMAEARTATYTSRRSRARSGASANPE